MALLIKEKLPTKRLNEWETIKITVWTFMVSELIQDLEISVQISVFNLPNSLSFPRNISVSSIRTRIYVWNIFPRKTAGTNPSDNSILFENHCLSRVSLTFQATAFQDFWSIELNPVSLHGSLNTDCIQGEVQRPSFQLERLIHWP